MTLKFVDTVPFKNLAIAALFANILLMIAILLIQPLLPPQIPLFYGLPEGNEQLAPSLQLILPSLLSLFVLIVNILISHFSKEEFLKKTLIIAAVAITAFSVITSLKIVFLVGNF
jgi:hypothetical protein